MRLIPNRKPAPAVPSKHVIAKYQHRTQSVICECGWQGSSATDGIHKSDWSLHVATNRDAPTR